jgi:hypothetical protein
MPERQNVTESPVLCRHVAGITCPTRCVHRDKEHVGEYGIGCRYDCSFVAHMEESRRFLEADKTARMSE